MSFRLCIAILGFIGILFLPVWVPFVCMIVLSVRYRAWECIVMGFLIDLLWMPAASLHAIPLYTVAALLLVWGFEPLRTQFFVMQ